MGVGSVGIEWGGGGGGGGAQDPGHGGTENDSR